MASFVDFCSLRVCCYVLLMKSTSVGFSISIGTIMHAKPLNQCIATMMNDEGGTRGEIFKTKN